MLLDSDEQISQAAERSLITLALSLALRDLANTTAAPFLAGDLDPSLGQALVSGLSGPADLLLHELAKGAMNYGEHRRRGAVLGALLVASRARLRASNPGATALRAWLDSEDATVQGAVRAVLRWSRTPLLRLRALELLGSPAHQAAPGERLVRAKTLLEHELVLSQAHLLIRPRRAAASAELPLATKPAPTRGKPAPGAAYDAPLPPAKAVRHLSPPARLGVVTFTLSLKATAQQRREVLEPFAADPVPAVRHAAMRAIPAAGLLEFCFDPDERVARSAALSWSVTGALVQRQNGPPPAHHLRALALLARSPYDCVRTWAAQDLESAPDPAASTLAGRLAARTLLAENRPAFMARLRAALADHSRAQGALALARTLGLVPELLPEVLALTRPDTQPRLLATAVAAISGLGDHAAIGAATNLLSHANDRVRANAVETLGRARAPQVVELKSDANHRVRANVLRAQALSDASPAMTDDLTSMLTDSRPMHRLAGAWLAARTLPARIRAGDPAPELLARIAEAARFDDNPSVRARAVACTQRLAADLRLVWHAPHPPQSAHAA